MYLPTTLSAQIKFQDIGIEAAEKILSKEQSPYLIYFSGEWCPSCKMMEATTFKDKQLADRINNNYLAFKIDVDADDKTGKNWMKTYAVYSLPTTLIYNQKGKLLKRIEKSLTASQFLALTENLGNPNFLSFPKSNKPIKNKEKKPQVAAEYQAPKISIPVSTEPTNNKKLIQSKKIISYLNLEKPIQNGQQYIVQLGIYRNIRSVERLVQFIRNRVDYPVKVLIEKEGSTSIHTIYLGEFKTKKGAIAANKSLIKIKRKGFVKKF